MNISMEEDQKTLEYQNTLKMYVKISPKTIKIFIPIYEDIHASFLKKQIFSQFFLDLCKNILNQPQFITSDVIIVLKKWLWNKGYMNQWSWYVKIIKKRKKGKDKEIYLPRVVHKINTLIWSWSWEVKKNSTSKPDFYKTLSNNF